MKHIKSILLSFFLLTVCTHSYSADLKPNVYWSMPAVGGELICAATGAIGSAEYSQTLQYRLKSGGVVTFDHSSVEPWLLSPNREYLSESSGINIYRLSDVSRSLKAERTYSVWLYRKAEGRTMTKKEQDAYFRVLFDDYWLERKRPGKTYEEALELAKTDPKIYEEVNDAIKEAREMIKQQLSSSERLMEFNTAGWLNANTLVACVGNIEDYGSLTLAVNVETKIVTFYVRSLAIVTEPELLKRDDPWLSEHFFISEDLAAKGLTLKFERGEIPAEVQKLSNDLQRRRERESKERNAEWKRYEEEMKRKTPPKE